MSNNNNESNILIQMVSKMAEDMSKTRDDVAEIKLEVAENRKDWQHHMRRTETNEELIALQDMRLKSLENQSAIINFITKAFAWAVGSGTILALIKYLS